MMSWGKTSTLFSSLPFKHFPQSLGRSLRVAHGWRSGLFVHMLVRAPFPFCSRAGTTTPVGGGNEAQRAPVCTKQQWGDNKLVRAEATRIPRTLAAFPRSSHRTIRTLDDDLLTIFQHNTRFWHALWEMWVSFSRGFVCDWQIAGVVVDI